MCNTILKIIADIIIYTTDTIQLLYNLNTYAKWLNK